MSCMPASSQCGFDQRRAAMTTRPLYPRGRLSAPIASRGSGLDDARPSRVDYDLIARLRDAREQGDGAMAAVEKYDPNFAIKLSSCAEEEEAERLLDAWLSRRVDVLKRIQGHLREVWNAGRDRGHPRS